MLLNAHVRMSLKLRKDSCVSRHPRAKTFKLANQHVADLFRDCRVRYQLSRNTQYRSFLETTQYDYTFVLPSCAF